ncbi:epoxide hydrolase [Microdochium trichocladiopsis]|uniref:Epoxide hydrolase n=1 Tax=Microdochium trichocladiopsis TaxID=1682393 RepID=A0A9P9BXG4_9PEZI|nr:epoxide hydrolase [Microdochium trichocladiopsis]KAH7036046.1 epoxide hydrolase [Microdochium trichocladiopsis]
MSKKFSTVPREARRVPEAFTLHVPDQELDDFRTLLKLSRIGPETYYNRQEDGQFGVSRKWLIEAKDAWLQSDWRGLEDRVNAFPNFKAQVNTPEGHTVEIHFIALFSDRADAKPVICMHGWPGSFLEFLPILGLLVAKYTPDTLPYHVVVPSLPGYGLSSDASRVDVEVDLAAATAVLHQLMLDLGFKGGYAASGGDVGSAVARNMSHYAECKAVHVNLMIAASEGAGLTEEYYSGPGELEHLKRRLAWDATARGYSTEHGTRPATIGLALSSSPLALLAWIGEKYIEWADPRQPLSLECILDCVGLYWFTSTFPRSIYPYRGMITGTGWKPTSKDTPLGYSYFRRELGFIPKAWVDKNYPNLIFYRAHEEVSVRDPGV